MNSNNTSQEPENNLAVANKDYRQQGFIDLKQRLRILMDSLAEVLTEEIDFTDSIPWREKQVVQRPMDTEGMASMAQLQAVCFEILNIVEERTATVVRQRRRRDFGVAADRGMWGSVIAALHEAGFSQEQVIKALK